MEISYLNTATLRSEISNVYGRVAVAPDGDFHFHRGPAYAADNSLPYPSKRKKPVVGGDSYYY